MPEVSRFYGIVIQIYFADHNPPHFTLFTEVKQSKLIFKGWPLWPVALPRGLWEW